MTRVVLVHGFTQTGASWEPIAARLRAAGHEVLTPDVAGHGGKPAASLPEAADALAGECGEAVYAGYSMGGRLCLHVALQRPSSVKGLVLLGATAGIDDPRERNKRRHADELLATRLEAIGLDAFLDEWLAQPLFAGLTPSAADLAGRRANTTGGLAGALRLAGTGAQEPLWDRLGQIGTLGIPTLVLAGELDGKFKALANRLAAAVGPAASTAWVPGAGHAAHLERPGEFLALVEPFLATMV